MVDLVEGDDNKKREIKRNEKRDKKGDYKNNK